ncbi:MAG: type II toxin-antitoxin system PemK/MazF family toxin [Candidatus Margulisiibacteriota bacterium]|jgi:mRNA interferase MazF
MHYSIRDLVLVPVPFTDLSTNKQRPGLIIYKAIMNDILIMPLTSNLSESLEGELLTEVDFETGHILKPSKILYMKIFTIAESKIIKKFAKLNKVKFQSLIDHLYNNLQKFN